MENAVNEIVVEDYNYMFEALFLLEAAIIVLYFYFVNPFDAHNEISRRYFFVHAMFITIIPGLVFYFQLRKSKRQIVLDAETITFKEGETVLEEIRFDNIKTVQKTFNDYYMKSQQTEGLAVIFLVVLTPIILPLRLINKFFFHLFKGGVKSYYLFDSIIIFDHNERFINILFTGKNERQEIRNYLLQKCGIDFEQSEPFFKLNYDYKEGEKQ